MIRQASDGLKIGFYTWQFTISTITPTWIGNLTPTTPLYLWMKNPVVMTLPVLQETQLYSVTYTHSVYAIPLTTYNADGTCQPGGTGTCYSTVNNVDTLAGFSAIVTNPAAIIFTVEAMITDRTYIATDWIIVHMIKQGTRVIGFMGWQIAILDCC